MPIIDAQVHAYEANTPSRPWVGHLAGPPEVTGDHMVAAMDEVGVHGALLVSPYSLYRFDPSYAQRVHAVHGRRFALIKPVNTQDPAVEEVVADWAATKGTVAIRVMLNPDVPTDPADRGINRAYAAAGRHHLPVNTLGYGRLDQIAGIAARNPNTVLVLDHLGLRQPFEPPAPPNPWADLPKVLALAAYPNVRVKITGACTLSHKPFPYDDIWDPLCRIIDTFGVDRCLWGTDWTRATALLTYKQGVDAFLLSERFSDADRVALMGGTLERVYRWLPSV